MEFCRILGHRGFHMVSRAALYWRGVQTMDVEGISNDTYVADG
jgi:hypothetical protein